ncbi:MAG: TRAP transporter permease [Oscillospiraceae bacterium]|nr:TRAP transporter permease [Oscillospiraceae bacterium]
MADEEKEEQESLNDSVQVSEQVSDEELAHIMAQYDKGSSTRHFHGVPKVVMRWLCIAFTVFVLAINLGAVYIPFTGINIFRLMLPPQVHRASFVGLVVLYSFLLYPANRKNNVKVNYIPWYDFAFAVIGLAAFFYYALRFETIALQRMMFTQMDFIVAVIGIAILFIACYRILGLPLLCVVGTFLAYAYFGRWIPGRFGHAGYRVHRIFTFLFYTDEGVIGTPIGVASSFIFMFMLFGAFLQKTGIGLFFIDIANAIAGRATGGPAKVAVIASALEGMVSGSSVANTVSSGSFTIPLMKRLGYDKDFAGAVEAAASTGGQIMPPTMGAAAFLMAEITGIPFSQIALAALIPAILYFSCVFASIHFQAKKIGLRPMPPDEIPKFLPLMLKKGHMLLGLVAIAFFLFLGYTPTRAALFATLVSIGLSMIRKDTRMTPRAFFDALELAAKNTISIGVACAMAGMIVGVVVLTGLGLTFANSMISLAEGINSETFRLFAVLFFSMISSLVLGLGVPTTAKYVILATVTAPILVRLGVPLIAAHLFVLFFGTDADITPPVGLASYAASAISRGNPLRTSVIATKLAAAGYIIPYFFAFNPAMLFVDATPLRIVQLTIFGFIGIVAVAAGLSGYFFGPMRIYERILAFPAGLLLIDPGLITKVIGIAILAAIIVMQILRRRHNKNSGSGPLAA